MNPVPSQIVSEQREATSLLSRSAFALHANTIITAGLGYLFMILASHLYEEERLGQDMALVSAMMLLAALAEFNLGMILPKFLPTLGRRSQRTVMQAYVASSTAALVFAGIFVFVAPRVSNSFEFLGASAGLGAMFVISVAVWNVFALQDSILVSVRRALWVPFENGIFSVAKVVLMVVWANSTVEHGVFLSWVVPMAIMVIPITGALFGVALPKHAKATESLEGEKFERRKVARYMGIDYISSLLTQGGTTILPLVVLVVLGAEANASFAIAFSIATAIEQFSINVGISLLVEGSYDRYALARLLRHTFQRFGLLLLAVVGGILVLTPLILFPFGDPYPETVPTVLRLFAVGLVFQAIVITYQAVERVRGNAGRVLISTLGQMVLTLTFVSVLGNAFGLAGVGWGWITGNAIVATCVLPSLIRVASARPAHS